MRIYSLISLDKAATVRLVCYSFCLIFCLIFFSCTSTHTVWLDELDMANADQSTGLTRANQSMWRTPLVIASDTFARGIGTHADGVIRIELDGKIGSFEALVGIDDSAPEHERRQASVAFKIVGDGCTLWHSNVMHAGDKAQAVNVSLKGVRQLLLYTLHTGDGIVGDRANWVNARFEVAGVDPFTVLRPAEEARILTPVEALLPLINAPYRYGASPENPVLFTLPISGERPVTVEIDSLPAGLSLNPHTGVITGKVRQKGTYRLNVTVSNAHGSDNCTFTLEIGELLALTPPMGWNSWNLYGSAVDDRKIRATADALVESGLIHYGYAYLNIDDGWQGQRGGKYNAIQPNEKFPDMKALVDYVHGKGLKIGIYSSPWVQTFAGYAGGSADTPDGKVNNPSRRTGEYDFTENDVKQWAEWGFDYLKYDWVTNDVKNTAIMEKQLRQSGRDIVFSISNAAPFDLAAEWAEHTNLRRTTGDIVDSWCSMTTIGFLQSKWQPYAAPGSWNDPDMLVVGKVGWGDTIRNTRLSPDEQYTHLSLWSLLAAPLMIGCDLTQMDDFTLSLLTNREVIAVNQDITGIQGKRIFPDNDRQTEIWSKPLSDGSQAVGLFNRSEKEQTVTVLWEQLNINGAHIVRNLWEQKDSGTFDGSFSAQVPSHGVVLVKLR
jgi:alpha-galactosidase